MAESPDETASNGDISDDGRVAPTRCDSCRLRNLKCDRILPTCNQCRWTPVTDCTYTPLPTPAHRGVPRCDRCRESNLKCDRAAPDCRYTPKKRARHPNDNQPLVPTSRIPYNTQAQTASFIRTFVNENLNRGSADHSRADGDPAYPRRGSFSEGPPLALLPAPLPPSSYQQQPFISHSFPEPAIQNLRVKPWAHPSFHPLPDLVMQRLGGLKTVEMPSREEFDRALEEFLSKLMPDLRETACLPPEAYATLANCLSKSNITRLSPRIRAWATCHRLCSGSDKLNLIVAPRDSYFHLTPEEQYRLIKDYRTSLDRAAPHSSVTSSPTQKSDKDGTDTQPLFERVPVQPQVYDCLAYAHRGHASSIAVMMEIRRLNITSITWPMAEIFISLCPLCKISNNGGSSLATTKGLAASTSTATSSR
ncbi:hypothetical protein C8R46DRAFT_1106358 [Mycena filopes]|nr:hypothetical protein C8R46DRAFT_1106358 [Mycena filopes]